MDVAQTCDALRASARSGETFPWWCLSDDAELVRAYYRHNTDGSTMTRQVVYFTPVPLMTYVPFWGSAVSGGDARTS